MNFLSKLPKGANSVLSVMAISMPIVMMAGMAQPQMLKWFLGGYLALTVFAALGAFFISKKEKKKAESFSEEIKGNAADNQGINDPKQLQEVDDLRQEFQRGIDIYKQYGRDLYSLPWYVVVGESGSGKTEALRRSEIGFPDKLQDYWQGTGGTLSMHWWFTNRAVIIDTAGKLFVRDGASNQGPQSQWTSFLKMLRKNRPDCPINGLVLVIPATSLVSLDDPAQEAASLSEVDNKAGQIAKQMEVLQTELGVCFPVYVLITKTDRIIGFREFFEGVETPDERYQMLGWSNPAPLDQVFRPEAVVEHLHETAQRLRRRRLSLLKDPVPAPTQKRFDEVDALFALPASFEGLAPKLERYLRHVFTVDEWSARPPFLRGIYFTSALQQGAVLDEALARSIGMSMEEYERMGGEEDLSLAKNRSYFLRDFFLEKVFAESGLVSKSSKKMSRLHGWKFWLPTGLVSALILVGLLGWLTGRSAPPELKSWRFLADEGYSVENYGFRPAILPGSSGKWAFAKTPVPIEDLLNQLSTLGGKHLKSRPQFGWLFKPAVLMDGNVKADRARAYRIAVDRVIVEPLLEAAIEGLADGAERWAAEGVSELDADALRELVGILGSNRTEGDMESTVEVLTRAADLPFTKNRNRDLYRDITGPMIEAISSAYPEGHIPVERLSEPLRGKLGKLMSSLLGAQGESDISSLLEKYDSAWSSIRQMEKGAAYAEVETRVAALATSSEQLKRTESQLRSLLEDRKEGEAAPSGGRNDGRKLAAELLTESHDALEKLDPAQLDRWQEALAVDEGASAEIVARRSELAKAHGSLIPGETTRNHEARASLCSELLKLGEGLDKQPDIEASRRLLGSVASIENRAKALGMEKEAAVLLDAWALQFTRTEFAERLGFPLVFDALRLNKPGEERVMTAEQAAALTQIAGKLAQLSDGARGRLRGVLDIAYALFDSKKLADSAQPWRAAVLSWELRLGNPDTHDWLDVPTISVVSPEDPSKRIEWTSTANAVGLLPADYGAEPRFINNLGQVAVFNRGSYPSWAAIHWYLSQIGGQGLGARHQFNGKEFGIAVSPGNRDTCPTELGKLPATTDLTQ